VAKGTRPGNLPAVSHVEPEGRVCAHPGCETKLSIYNGSELCWQHADVTFPNFRGKRLRGGRS
jgi:hypothetical protein